METCTCTAKHSALTILAPSLRPHGAVATPQPMHLVPLARASNRVASPPVLRATQPPQLFAACRRRSRRWVARAWRGWVGSALAGQGPGARLRLNVTGAGCGSVGRLNVVLFFLFSVVWQIRSIAPGSYSIPDHVKTTHLDSGCASPCSVAPRPAEYDRMIGDICWARYPLPAMIAPHVRVSSWLARMANN